eukprot:gnl/MRDRNA2_/MRDRNA2_35520_c0_seq1.p1 gnl/MRDRNA2_/MRDRNA2_35520_c0~~gnl/MRDRNA2_/MRDRNA2_35520_c0_seq1.p1  ORF type:complete len:208 (-),score=34.72 gnl/MRDRNA2_/MRDRNA2_35520_c0_seq1:7-630(-)
MPEAHETYVHCDELDGLPLICKENWLQETRHLQETLPHGCRVLQVGCMDGTRILSILKGRPDLQMTGLDIDDKLLQIAKKNFERSGVAVDTYLGDIADESVIDVVGGRFDVVVCLNNTLGYIERWRLAITVMEKLSSHIVLSLYGPQFDDSIAEEYFKSLGLKVDTIDGDSFHLADFGIVNRFRSEDLPENFKMIHTPLGYICTTFS